MRAPPRPDLRLLTEVGASWPLIQVVMRHSWASSARPSRSRTGGMQARNLGPWSDCSLGSATVVLLVLVEGCEPEPSAERGGRQCEQRDDGRTDAGAAERRTVAHSEQISETPAIAVPMTRFSWSRGFGGFALLAMMMSSARLVVTQALWCLGRSGLASRCRGWIRWMPSIRMVTMSSGAAIRGASG